MPKKIQYRAVDVHQLSLESLLEGFEPGSRVVVGVDVAKRKFLAALSDAQGEARQIVRFEHPSQTGAFVQLLDGLRQAGRTVEVAMEPTGTYGDPLRYLLGGCGIEVFRVNNKHVHDAAELFDRSASKHDAKDACLIGWLHIHQRSTRWHELSEDRRSIRALIAQRELFDDPLRRLRAQLEPLLARHFPELEKFFDLSRRKTPYRLLETYGSPAALVRAGAEQVTQLLHKAARRPPDSDLVHGLLQAARTTSGVALVADELQLVRMMASEILRLLQMRDEVDARIEKAIAHVREAQAMRPCLGAVTAAVVFAYLGAPSDYACAAALEKAAGLNLVERSSGNDLRTDPGPRHLSKRGPGVVRKYLFLAAMRLIQANPVVKAWYQARSSFKADAKAKALIAVERKLCRALFHVAAGNPFDATKLFDTRRLVVESSSQEAA
jgi:transposase